MLAKRIAYDDAKAREDDERRAARLNGAPSIYHRTRRCAET